MSVLLSTVCTMSVSHYTTKVWNNNTIQNYMPGNTLAYNHFKVFSQNNKKTIKPVFIQVYSVCPYCLSLSQHSNSSSLPSLCECCYALENLPKICGPEKLLSCPPAFSLVFSTSTGIPLNRSSSPLLKYPSLFYLTQECRTENTYSGYTYDDWELLQKCKIAEFCLPVPQRMYSLGSLSSVKLPFFTKVAETLCHQHFSPSARFG